jgi:hypothetical protein
MVIVLFPNHAPFNILQPWSPQHGITKIYHTIMKYSKRSYVRNAMNKYVQLVANNKIFNNESDPE